MPSWLKARIPGRTDPEGRLGPPESQLLSETAGKAGKTVVFHGRQDLASLVAGRVEIVRFDTSEDVSKPGFLMSFILFKGQKSGK